MKNGSETKPKLKKHRLDSDISNTSAQSESICKRSSRRHHMHHYKNRKSLNIAQSKTSTNSNENEMMMAKLNNEITSKSVRSREISKHISWWDNDHANNHVRSGSMDEIQKFNDDLNHHNGHHHNGQHHNGHHHHHSTNIDTINHNDTRTRSGRAGTKFNKWQDVNSSDGEASSSGSDGSSESEDSMVITAPKFRKSLTVGLTKKRRNLLYESDSKDEESSLNMKSGIYGKLQQSDVNVEDMVHSKFIAWLCTVVKLGEYITNFEQNGKADIRKIKYFNDGMLKDLGIMDESDRALILDEAKEFGKLQMEFVKFLDGNEVLKPFKQKLRSNGILTANDLKMEVKNKNDLMLIFELDVDERKEIEDIWNVVHPTESLLKSDMKLLQQHQTRTMHEMELLIQQMIEMDEKIYNDNQYVMMPNSLKIQHCKVIDSYYARLENHKRMLDKLNCRNNMDYINVNNGGNNGDDMNEDVDEKKRKGKDKGRRQRKGKSKSVKFNGVRFAINV